MPDTNLPFASDVAPSSSVGILGGYRSASIGQLVAARAKATSEIKRVIKDKKADIPNKNGGRSYSYQYADLAAVLEAVDDALAMQELALFQTLVDRKGVPYLVTTLAHSSDQWIASEIRVGGLDSGPQVFGSALTYMRRYSALSVLGLAPEADDDGRAAQDKADQQSRQRQRADAPPPVTKAPQQAPDEPVHMPIQAGTEGLLLGRWTRQALDDLHGRPESWRRRWLELHQVELDDLRRHKPEYADKVASVAVAPDLPTEQPAAE